MRLSFIIHQVFGEEITSIPPLIKIPPQRTSFKHQADGPISVTLQTVLRLLMDLKISPLHDSCFFALQLGDRLRQGAVQEPHTRELSDTKSHVSRLSYCFVSAHVISQYAPPPLCRPQPAGCGSRPFYAVESLSTRRFLSVLNHLKVLCFTSWLSPAWVQQASVAAAVTLQMQMQGCFGSQQV